MRPSIRPWPLARGTVVASLLALLGAAAGCGGSGNGATPAPAGNLRPANTGSAALKFFTGDRACGSLETYLKDSLLADMAESLEQQRSWYNRYGDSMAAATPVFAPTPTPAPAAPEASSSYSSTTVRTAGVDEADTVKNDGRRIISVKDTANGITLSRVDLAGAGRMALAGQVTWQRQTSGGTERADGLYLLDGDRAAVLTANGGWDVMPAVTGLAPPTAALSTMTSPVTGVPDIPITRLRLVDLSTPTLATRWETTLSGRLLGSRRVGERIHLVTQTALDLPDGASYYANYTGASSAGLNAAIDEQLATNERVVRAASLETLLAPLGQQGTPTAAECGSFARIDAPSRIGFLRVTTIDLAGQTATNQTALGQASGLYLSQQSLILMSPEWQASSDSSTGSSMHTYLHRFTADGQGGFGYQGSGSIEGSLLNPYAIDETDAGIVRVAVNTSAATGQPFSYVATLKPAAAPQAWTALGRSDPIAPGEQLRSARFVGDRAYLVTFLQIDPFFVFDLSDPARPTALGELKIPGFSTWLQPVGENHVLGVGYGEGSPREIKASLFNVSDPRNPVEQSTLVLGRSFTSSDALWDPHAFTWYSPVPAVTGIPSGGIDGTFAIPVRSYYQYYGTTSESAVRLVTVRPEAGGSALSLNGSISLNDQLNSSHDATSWESWRQADARRAVFVDSTAYAIADGVIRSAPITAPAQTIETLVLP